MSRDLSRLAPAFLGPFQAALDEAEAAGLDILVTCTYRSPEEQARLYRQSRTTRAIEQKIEQLRVRGFDFLAAVLYAVGPQPGTGGRHVTMAGPGESWHNYGVAADGVILVDGKPDWAVKHPTLWERWGLIAERNRLEWAGRWESFRELPHVQLGVGSNPLKVLGVEGARYALNRARMGLWEGGPQ